MRNHQLIVIGICGWAALGACKGEAPSDKPTETITRAVTGTADANVTAAKEASAETLSPWARHEDPEGHFSALMPATPKVEEARAPTAWGERQARVVSAIGKDPKAIYMVNVIPLKEAEVKAGEAALIDQWQERLLAGGAGMPVKLDQRAELKLVGGAGRWIHVSVDGAKKLGRRGQYVGVVHGARFYELGFLPIEEAADDVVAKRFFESLALTD